MTSIGMALVTKSITSYSQKDKGKAVLAVYIVVKKDVLAALHC